MNNTTKAPLSDYRVVHLASWGPGPYAAMLLADMGCDVIIVDRRTEMITTVPAAQDPRRRGQRSIALDLKNQEDKATFLQLIATADVFIEGMRPGAAERLGIGPEVCMDKNSRLIYSRMTGWGQEGTLAHTAGHDINYIALSGALHAMGDPEQEPAIPLNLLGDYGGGGLFLITGILAALLEREKSGQGQVVDGAIVDGVASLTAATLGMKAVGRWGDRGTNTFDGSCPWYCCYRTKDNKFVAVGAIEEAFYRELLRGLGLARKDWPRDNPEAITALKHKLTEIFASQSRDYWQALFENTDACVTPVLDFDEALEAPHHRSRGTYVEVEGIPQPMSGPRLSRSPFRQPSSPPSSGEHSSLILEQLKLL